MKLQKNIALSDTGFVFNPSTGDSFSVNPVGLGILKDLKDGKDEKDIVGRIVNEYQTPKEVAEKDVNDFFRMIKLFNLIEYNG
jgi:hypothetical protein